MDKAQSCNRSQKSSTKRVPFAVKTGEAKEVIVTGDFTGWKDEGIRLNKTPGGEWRTTLTLEPGEYQYRLKVDGEWRDNPEAQKRVPNPYGSENCVLSVD